MSIGGLVVRLLCRRRRNRYPNMFPAFLARSFSYFDVLSAPQEPVHHRTDHPAGGDFQGSVGTSTAVSSYSERVSTGYFFPLGALIMDLGGLSSSSYTMLKSSSYHWFRVEGHRPQQQRAAIDFSKAWQWKASLNNR